jgi:glycerol-3-phosphate dehydrogenase
MNSKSYDLAIIGGGIHGVGAAQAAAAAGYSVAVLEMNGLASGTSGKSSKLIHGGLRYLETAQLSLVKECLHERELLLKNAPGLVALKKIFIPVYRETVRRPWIIRAGLSLYYALSGFNRDSGFISVPKREWANLDGIDINGIQAVFQYHEAQTDDSLLTKAVMDSAMELGAALYMPAKFTGAIFENGGWSVTFEKNGIMSGLRASCLVNAGGPWANMILEKIVPTQKKVAVDLVQGSHIILEGRIERGIYYVESPMDRRGVFVMPWKGNTMIGTTETVFNGDPSGSVPLESEIRYLLETAGRYFPRFHSAGAKDVLDSFAGLRVLPSAGGSLFSRSRETLLHCEDLSKTKLVSIIGGKLTSYRATGESVIGKIAPYLPSVKARADTKKLPLK